MASPRLASPSRKPWDKSVRGEGQLDLQPICASEPFLDRETLVLNILGQRWSGVCSMEVRTARDVLLEILNTNGPLESDYLELDCAIRALHSHDFRITRGSPSTMVEDSLSDIFKEFEDVFLSTNTMQGFARVKPHGYAGDWEIIERIYNRHVNNIEIYRRWDEFFHRGNAPNAVRNRSNFLSCLIERYQPRNFISVACGPGFELCQALSGGHLPGSIHILDNEHLALRFAQSRLMGLEKSVVIHAIYGNAFRVMPRANFDFVWCSGLFDYLSDRASVVLLKKMRSCVQTGAKIVFGNFSLENESRAYMELIGDWRLIHRTAQDLVEVALGAGFQSKDILINSDETGLQLYGILTVS